LIRTRLAIPFGGPLETNTFLARSKGFIDEKTAEKMRKEEEKIKEMAKAMEKEERKQANAAQSGDTQRSVTPLVYLYCMTYIYAASSIRLRSCGRANMHRRR
jgi:hypothetical protein